ncbi:hypothetical protein [Actinomadura harenae]|uniref:hypothetical protein n=1 Tax=Actinomadura harenae TaxID=2483351 RepID=UPI0018F6AD6C|nr:hypothetical protein [Actinomadura harenae]
MRSDEAAGPVPGGAGAPAPTGDPRVDAVVARLDELAGLPVPAHVEVFADVHQRLQELLVSADDDGESVPSLGGMPRPGAPVPGGPGSGGPGLGGPGSGGPGPGGHGPVGGGPRPGGMPRPGGFPRPGGLPGQGGAS